MFPFFKKKFLYFPGCFTTSVLPEIVANYEKILDSLQIPYIMLDDLGCCGAIAFTNGYKQDFEELRGKNIEIIKDKRIKQLVTNSGNCMQTFALYYGFSVQHITQVLVAYTNKFPVKFEEGISIYDSPSLPVYEEPREILDALGFDVIELEKNKDQSLLCGCEGGMIQNTPELAKKMARSVFDLCTTKKLVVIDPLAYYHLRNNAPSRLEVIELSEVLL